MLDGAFSLTALALLESNNSSSLEEDRLYTLIEEALRARVLTEECSGLHISYRFWHPLLAHHLYHSLSAARRQMLHRRAANVLRQVYATAEHDGAALILHHLLLAGSESRELIYYADMAGDRAYALSAYPEAERFYLLAAEHALTTPASELKPQSSDDALLARQSFLFERLR